MFSYVIITIGFLYLLLIVVILPLKLRNQKKHIDRNIFDSFLDEDHVFFWSKKKDNEKLLVLLAGTENNSNRKSFMKTVDLTIPNVDAGCQVSDHQSQTPTSQQLAMALPASRDL